MYYHIQSQQIISDLPGSAFNSSGTLVQGLSNFDTTIIADCGFLTVRSDTTQPANTIEDYSSRVVSIDYPYVDITRVWVPEPLIVPQSISARQIRLWMVDNNISLTSVKSAINSIVDETLREKTMVEWEYAPYIERDHPLINTIGQMLGLTEQQIDQGFISASKL